MTSVSLVAARARNGVIGADGAIPWRIRADFAHFKRTTLGHPLVLGRTTFEGIAAASGGPLPDRRSIVVTRDPSWSYAGVLTAGSVPEAVELGRSLDAEVVHVGGGAQVYAAAYDLADAQVITEVDLAPAGDTFYPDFDEAAWTETRREDHPAEGAVPAWSVRWLVRAASVRPAAGPLRP